MTRSSRGRASRWTPTTSRCWIARAAASSFPWRARPRWPRGSSTWWRRGLADERTRYLQIQRELGGNEVILSAPLGKTPGRKDAKTQGRTEGRNDGKTERQAGGRTDGQADGRTDGRADSEPEPIERPSAARTTVPPVAGTPARPPS